MLDIPFITRQLYPDELRILKRLRTKQVQEIKKGYKFYYLPICVAVGAGLLYLASIVKIGFFEAVFAFIGGTLVASIVFVPYELYKERKRNNARLKNLDALIEGGTVATLAFNAKRIAIAPEYEDEGIIYVVEYDTDKLLFIWDVDFSMTKKFPCLHFELYEEKFFKVVGRRSYTHSERIQPVIIDRKAKWKCLGSFPGDMETLETNFDKFVEEINNCLAES